MILLDRVTKSYGRDNKAALNRISLHVEPKEFVIIVGTSGAGKSTLLKLLTREEKPTSRIQESRQQENNTERLK